MDDLSANALTVDVPQAAGNQPPPPYTDTPLVCLEFKMPIRVHHQFAIYADRRRPPLLSHCSHYLWRVSIKGDSKP